MRTEVGARGELEGDQRKPPRFLDSAGRRQKSLRSGSLPAASPPYFPAWRPRCFARGWRLHSAIHRCIAGLQRYIAWLQRCIGGLHRYKIPAHRCIAPLYRFTGGLQWCNPPMHRRKTPAHRCIPALHHCTGRMHRCARGLQCCKTPVQRYNGAMYRCKTRMHLFKLRGSGPRMRERRVAPYESPDRGAALPRNPRGSRAKARSWPQAALTSSPRVLRTVAV